jgi:hypothetical protein
LVVATVTLVAVHLALLLLVVHRAKTRTFALFIAAFRKKPLWPLLSAGLGSALIWCLAFPCFPQDIGSVLLVEIHARPLIGSTATPRLEGRARAGMINGLACDPW